MFNIKWQFKLDKDVILKEFNYDSVISNKLRACFINEFLTASVAEKVLHITFIWITLEQHYSRVLRAGLRQRLYVDTTDGGPGEGKEVH